MCLPYIPINKGTALSPLPSVCIILTCNYFSTTKVKTEKQTDTESKAVVLFKSLEDVYLTIDDHS